jgi:hypothetical protein
MSLTKERIEQIRKSGAAKTMDEWQELYDLAIRGLETQWRPISEADKATAFIVGWLGRDVSGVKIIGHLEWGPDCWCAPFGPDGLMMEVLPQPTHFVSMSAIGEPQS